MSADAPAQPSAASTFGAVIAASTVACLVGWVPLAAVHKFINEAVARMGPIQIFSICASMRVGSPEMQVCSAMVALVAEQDALDAVAARVPQLLLQEGRHPAGHVEGLLLERFAHSLPPAVDGRANTDLGQVPNEPLLRGPGDEV